MNKLIIAISIILSLLSCNKQEGDLFEVTGTLKGAENKLIILETMAFPEINRNAKFTVLDTARADAVGNFKIKNYLNERMIFR